MSVGESQRVSCRIATSLSEALPPVAHDDLAHDLALWVGTPKQRSDFRGRLTWENIQFPDERVRPDVFSILTTLNPQRICPITYEVKVSRSDLLAELRSQKWKKYLPFSAYVFIAMPHGLADDNEIPDQLGILHRFDTNWFMVRKGKRNKDWKFTERHWLNLSLKGRNPSPFEIYAARHAK